MGPAEDVRYYDYSRDERAADGYYYVETDGCPRSAGCFGSSLSEATERSRAFVLRLRQEASGPEAKGD